MSSAPTEVLSADGELLSQIRSYLTRRKHGLPPGEELEAAWNSFYDRYSRIIRVYAFSCGATDEEIVDCVQEVWRRVTGALAAVSTRSWPRSIRHLAVCHRPEQGGQPAPRPKRRLLQGNSNTLQTVADKRPTLAGFWKMKK